MPPTPCTPTSSGNRPPSTQHGRGAHKDKYKDKGKDKGKYKGKDKGKDKYKAHTMYSHLIWQLDAI